jgi:opacity protein-like surface antigen
LHSLKNGEAGYSSNFTGSYKANVKSESHYSAYIQPTYALNSSTALFLKASYHETKVNIRDNGILYIVNDYTKTLHGFGLGFGAMVFLNDNIFTKLEMEYVDYSQERIAYNSSSVGYKLSTTSGTLSIGYRF